MGNRAVITTKNAKFNDIGVYLHWYGGRDSVDAFLAYCEAKGYRSPDRDDYGWARLCQVIGNTLGGTLSLGIDTVSNLDCNNGDNGVYGLEGWSIAERLYHDGREEQGEEDDEQVLLANMRYINDRQPEHERITEETLAEYAKKHYNEWHPKGGAKE